MRPKDSKPNAYDPEVFKAQLQQASEQAKELAKSRQTLLVEDLSEGESVHFIFGPVPLGPGNEHVCFQAVWFGTLKHEVPLDEEVPPPAMMTEHPITGRMLMWLFDTHEEGAEFLGEMWDLTPPEPEIQ